MTLTKRCACEPDAQPKCEHAWNFRYKLEGRQYRGTTHTNVHKVALEVARADRTDTIRKRAGLMKDERPAMLLSAVLKRYTAFIATDHPATAARDVRVLTAFRDAFQGDPAIDTITTWQITKWQSARVGSVDVRSDGRKGRAKGRSTVETQMHAIRGLFRQAVIWQADTGLTVNPCARKAKGDKTSGVAALKFDEKKIRTATAAELARLAGAPTVVRLLCQLTVTSLGRLMELATIRPVDLDDAALRIHVRRKGGKVQPLPVTADQMRELRALVTTPQQRFVLFPGDVPSQQTLTNAIRRWWLRQGVRGVSHHTMRHTGVTAMLDAGVNSRAIQKLAGWSSLRMLERYGHAPDAELDRAVGATTALLMSGQKQRRAAPAKHRQSTGRSSRTKRVKAAVR